MLLLENDHDRTIHAMDHKAVHALSPLFQKYDMGNFKTNLKNLINSIAENKEAVKCDEGWLLHDQSIIQRREGTPRVYPRWDLHQAKSLLRKDIQQKLHEKIKPELLRMTRPEYQEFPLNIFRKHIYQEDVAQRGRSYWMHRKKKKQEMKKKAKRI